MAKRFIDTGFFKSPFVRGLKAPLKSLYLYIICDRDGAGIWVKDLPIASAYIGFEITEKDFLIFAENGKALDLKNGKYFFPDFLEHQYPQGLSEKNPAQKNFISELKKYNLIDENMQIIEAHLKTLQRPSKGSKVMVMEKEEEKVMVMEIPFESENFKKVWNELIKQPKWKKKTAAALQSSLYILSKLNEQQAIDCMLATIAGGWQGLFPEKTKQLQSKSDKFDQEFIKAAQNMGLTEEDFKNTTF